MRTHDRKDVWETYEERDHIRGLLASITSIMMKCNLEGSNCAVAYERKRYRWEIKQDEARGITRETVLHFSADINPRIRAERQETKEREDARQQEEKAARLELQHKQRLQREQAALRLRLSAVDEAEQSRKARHRAGD